MDDQIVFINGTSHQLSEISFEDIQCRVRTGRAVPMRSDGRRKEYSYRFGVLTKFGDIEKSDWMRIVKWVIDFHGESDLFQSILEWEKEQATCQSERNDLERYAMELHTMRIFDNELWLDFIPFNRKYRPERLVGVPVVTVTTECCRKPGVITRKRYDFDGGEETFCPYCGAFQRIWVSD